VRKQIRQTVDRPFSNEVVGKRFLKGCVMKVNTMLSERETESIGCNPSTVIDLHDAFQITTLAEKNNRMSITSVNPIGRLS
jgi:hypothetical protein